MVPNFIYSLKRCLAKTLALLSPITEGGFSMIQEKNDRLVMLLLLLLLLEFNADGVDLSLNYPAQGALFCHMP